MSLKPFGNSLVVSRRACVRGKEKTSAAKTGEGGRGDIASRRHKGGESPLHYLPTPTNKRAVGDPARGESGEGAHPGVRERSLLSPLY